MNGESELVRTVDAVRRRLRASDSEDTRVIAELPDSDLVWLLAQGWEPPPMLEQPRRREPGNGFTLTVEEYERYMQAVARAQEIKNMLNLHETTGVGRTQTVVELRAALQQEAQSIRAMSREWKQST